MSTALNQILPQRIDNTYRGHRPAVWFFIAVVVLKTGIALGTIFDGRTAARSADGISLDSFGASGSEAVVRSSRSGDLRSSCSACSAYWRSLATAA
jgi:hypothetical protein